MMAAEKDVQEELDRLRKEVESLRRARASEKSKDDQADKDKEKRSGKSREELEAELKEFQHAVKNFANQAEEEIAQRPLVAVLGAFVLGIVVGRLLGR